MKRKAKPMINPMATLAAHQKVGKEDADQIALPLLLHFDAAHRGKGTETSANFLTYHILVAQVLSTRIQNRSLYDMSVEAWNALVSACGRPVDLLAFTTGEYKAIKELLKAYLRLIPEAKVGLLSLANLRAKEVFDGLEREPA